MRRRSTLSESEQDQQRAFLRSIQETPEDDAPRLVYADWLDDHGDAERADFIRTQCRLEAMPRDAPGRSALRMREADLLRRHRSEWLGPWDSRSNEAVFRRGFLDAFHVGTNFGVGLSSLAPALSPYHDLTRTFAFQANRLAESLVPLLAGALPCLKRVACENCFRGNALVESMAAWPSCGLSELVVRRCEVGSAGVSRLAQAPWLASLRLLDLRDNLVGHDALTSLLLRPQLRGLESLAITAGREFTGRALVALLSNHLVALRRLRMQRPPLVGVGFGDQGAIDDDGLSLLIRSPALVRFSSLELLSQHVGDAGVQALAASPHARGLTTLNLRDNRIGDAGLAAVAGSPHLANLTCLDLSAAIGQGLFTLDGVRRLADSPFLSNLATLRLTVAPGSSDGAAEPFLHAGRLPKLRDLVLNVSLMTNVGLVERFRARGVELTTHYAGD